MIRNVIVRISSLKPDVAKKPYPKQNKSPAPASVLLTYFPILHSTIFQQLPLERLKYPCKSQALPGEGHRELEMGTTSPVL